MSFWPFIKRGMPAITEVKSTRPRIRPEDKDHQRIVTIDNDTQQPVLELYHTKEGTVPTTGLWAELFNVKQGSKGHVLRANLHSFLSNEGLSAIDPKLKYNLFPALLTSKGGIRSKDDSKASNTARGAVGRFHHPGETEEEEEEIVEEAATPLPTRQMLKQKAKALYAKANAIKKQADPYMAQAASEEDPTLDKDFDSFYTNRGLNFIVEEIGYSKQRGGTTHACA